MGELRESTRPLRIFLSTGDLSGDRHAARVVHELKQRADCEFLGLAGPEMRAAGVHPVARMEEVSVVGLSEILTRLPGILRARSQMLAGLRDKPDLVLPVDFPGFNIRLAERSRRLGLPVLYYVSPQIWAWGKGRISKLAGSVDRMAVVFPFEVPLYERAGIPVTYVGHPLAEELAVDLDEQQIRRLASLGEGEPYVALLPGSRPPEIRRLLPPMLAAVDRLRARRPGLGAVVAAASEEIAQQARQLGAGAGSGVSIITGHTHAVAAHARAAVVTSGTATLETAALGTPLVIVYRLSWSSWVLARFLVRVRWIGLANIVAEEEVAPELIQGEATGGAMARALEPLLDDGAVRRRTLERLTGLREKLGAPGAAARVADLALEIVRDRGGTVCDPASH